MAAISACDEGRPADAYPGTPELFAEHGGVVPDVGSCGAAISACVEGRTVNVCHVCHGTPELFAEHVGVIPDENSFNAAISAFQVSWPGTPELDADAGHAVVFHVEITHNADISCKKGWPGTPELDAEHAFAIPDELAYTAAISTCVRKSPGLDADAGHAVVVPVEITHNADISCKNGWPGTPELNAEHALQFPTSSLTLLLSVLA